MAKSHTSGRTTSQGADQIHLAGECRRLAEGLRIEGLYRLYEERATAFKAEPPPEDWTGVYVAESK